MVGIIKNGGGSNAPDQATRTTGFTNQSVTHAGAHSTAGGVPISMSFNMADGRSGIASENQTGIMNYPYAFD